VTIADSNLCAKDTTLTAVPKPVSRVFGMGLCRVVRKVRQHPDDHELNPSGGSEFTFRSDVLLTA
jgi:hypothetical protein